QNGTCTKVTYQADGGFGWITAYDIRLERTSGDEDRAVFLLLLMLMMESGNIGIEFVILVAAVVSIGVIIVIITIKKSRD
ncbi:MAG: hypothetical protein ACFFCM_15415, partial [Promethearchaeota archaeon]